jgi:hypothetical protein
MSKKTNDGASADPPTRQAVGVTHSPAFPIDGAAGHDTTGWS